VPKKAPDAFRFRQGNFRRHRTFLSHEGRGVYAACQAEEKFMSIGTIILIILVIALLGGFSGIGGGSFYGTGVYGGGGLGLVIVILLILLLLGKL
jgi:hypothetical protein